MKHRASIITAPQKRSPQGIWGREDEEEAPPSRNRLPLSPSASASTRISVGTSPVSISSSAVYADGADADAIHPRYTSRRTNGTYRSDAKNHADDALLSISNASPEDGTNCSQKGVPSILHPPPPPRHHYHHQHQHQRLSAQTYQTRVDPNRRSGTGGGRWGESNLAGVKRERVTAMETEEWVVAPVVSASSSLSASAGESWRNGKHGGSGAPHVVGGEDPQQQPAPPPGSLTRGKSTTEWWLKRSQNRGCGSETIPTCSTTPPPRANAWMAGECVMSHSAEEDNLDASALRHCHPDKKATTANPAGSLPFAVDDCVLSFHASTSGADSFLPVRSVSRRRRKLSPKSPSSTYADRVRGQTPTPPPPPRDIPTQQSSSLRVAVPPNAAGGAPRGGVSSQPPPPPLGTLSSLRAGPETHSHRGERTLTTSSHWKPSEEEEALSTAGDQPVLPPPPPPPPSSFSSSFPPRDSAGAGRRVGPEEEISHHAAPAQPSYPPPPPPPPLTTTRHPSARAPMPTVSSVQNTTTPPPPLYPLQHQQGEEDGGGFSLTSSLTLRSGGPAARRGRDERSWTSATVVGGPTRSPSPVNPHRGPLQPRHFIFTGLPAEEVASLTAAIETLGADAAVVPCAYDTPPPLSVTHVVLRNTPCSVKSMCALVSGRWLVTPEYVFRSCSVGYWLDELMEGGLRLSAPPLAGHAFVLTVPDPVVREKLGQVIEYGGGTVVRRRQHPDRTARFLSGKPSHQDQGDGDGGGGGRRRRLWLDDNGEEQEDTIRTGKEEVMKETEVDDPVVVIASGDELIKFATQPL